MKEIEIYQGMQKRARELTAAAPYWPEVHVVEYIEPMLDGTESNVVYIATKVRKQYEGWWCCIPVIECVVENDTVGKFECYIKVSRRVHTVYHCYSKVAAGAHPDTLQISECERISQKMI